MFFLIPRLGHRRSLPTLPGNFPDQYTSFLIDLGTKLGRGIDFELDGGLRMAIGNQWKPNA